MLRFILRVKDVSPELVSELQLACKRLRNRLDGLQVKMTAC